MSATNYTRALATLKRQQLEATLVCPYCEEQNMRGRSALIMLDERGIASCDKCGRTWTPKESA